MDLPGPPSRHHHCLLCFLPPFATATSTSFSELPKTSEHTVGTGSVLPYCAHTRRYYNQSLLCRAVRKVQQYTTVLSVTAWPTMPLLKFYVLEYSLPMRTAGNCYCVDFCTVRMYVYCIRPSTLKAECSGGDFPTG